MKDVLLVVLMLTLSAGISFAQEWTECLDIAGITCDDICAQRNMVCTNEGTTSRGYEGWGAEAWSGRRKCEGAGAGQAKCDFVGDPGGVRWKCHCVDAWGYTEDFEHSEIDDAPEEISEQEEGSLEDKDNSSEEIVSLPGVDAWGYTEDFEHSDIDDAPEEVSEQEEGSLEDKDNSGEEIVSLPTDCSSAAISSDGEVRLMLALSTLCNLKASLKLFETMENIKEYSDNPRGILEVIDEGDKIIADGTTSCWDIEGNSHEEAINTSGDRFNMYFGRAQGGLELIKHNNKMLRNIVGKHGVSMPRFKYGDLLDENGYSRRDLEVISGYKEDDLSEILEYTINTVHGWSMITYSAFQLSRLVIHGYIINDPLQGAINFQISKEQRRQLSVSVDELFGDWLSTYTGDASFSRPDWQFQSSMDSGDSRYMNKIEMNPIQWYGKHDVRPFIIQALYRFKKILSSDNYEEIY